MVASLFWLWNAEQEKHDLIARLDHAPLLNRPCPFTELAMCVLSFVLKRVNQKVKAVWNTKKQANKLPDSESTTHLSHPRIMLLLGLAISQLLESHSGLYSIICNLLTTNQNPTYSSKHFDKEHWEQLLKCCDETWHCQMLWWNLTLSTSSV